MALSSRSSVSGGYDNRARGIYSSVTEGSFNSSSANYSLISDGSANSIRIAARYYAVSGGRLNNAQGFVSSISGGYDKNIDAGIQGGVSEYDWKAGFLFETIQG